MFRKIYLRPERVVPGRHCRHGPSAATGDPTSTERKTAGKIGSPANGLLSLGFARRDKRGRGLEKSFGSLNEGSGSGLGVRVESGGTGSDVGRGHRKKRTRGCGAAAATATSGLRKRIQKLSNFVIT